MLDRSTGAFVEIVERRKQPVKPGDLISSPNEIRINGEAFYASADHPVTVKTAPDDLVYVTLTLLAHRVEFKAEQVED
jgi:hypothetical protein